MSNSNQNTWPEKYDIHQLVSIQADIDHILNGEKTSVRRNDRYADPGDTLELRGKTFIVKNVYPQKLADVSDEDAKQEGYSSLAEYKKGIGNIHGENVWDPDIEVWVHELRPKA